MIAPPRRDKRQQRRMSEQTMKDHIEIARRIRGRELELVRLSARLSSIIPSQKRKESLIKLANKRAVQLDCPFLPRLVCRSLPLMILWFADNYPEIFNCVSIAELLPPSPDGSEENAPPQKEEVDVVDDFLREEPVADFIQDNEFLTGWFAD
jgi:hypothetical protein